MNSPEYDCFKKGLKVEVSLDEVDFRGSWHTGSILETPGKRSRKILVEFDELTEEDNPKKRLRERVDYLLVRPICPRDPKDHLTFNVDDAVDALHKEGWWEGVITRIEFRSGVNRYFVFFRSSRELITFPASQLRTHREWVCGEWIPPLPEPFSSSDICK